MNRNVLIASAVALTTIVTVAIAPSLAKPSAAAGVDICSGAIDPYVPGSQRALFFRASGPDSELNAKEFTADRARSTSTQKTATPRAFAQRYDRWTSLLAFDRNGDKTIDWFEADAYRRALRRTTLAIFDKNKDSQLTGEERVAAIRALLAGKVRPAAPGTAARAPVAPVGPPPAPRPESGTHLPSAPGRFTRPSERRDRRPQGVEADVDEQLRKRYDTNRDGRLDDDERRAAFGAIRKRQRDEFMAKYDANGDGELSGEEKAAMRDERGAFVREKLEAWRLRDFDKDGDGKINDEEKAEADAYGKRFKQVGKDMDVMFNDLNGDGQVSGEERKSTQAEWKKAGWRLLVKAAKHMDTDGDGQISMAERTDFTRRATVATFKWIEKFSMSFDANKDGRLDGKERTELLAGFRKNMKERGAKFDADGDGRLSPEEALEMLEDFGRESGIIPDDEGKPAPE